MKETADECWLATDMRNAATASSSRSWSVSGLSDIFLECLDCADAAEIAVEIWREERDAAT